MSYAITESNPAELKNLKTGAGKNLDWSSVFVLPEWLQVWWQIFGEGKKQFIRVVREDDGIIGIAPLMVSDGTAAFMGGTDVCDYQDFIVAKGREHDFCSALLDDLKKNGINQLELKHVRPDSIVMTKLAGIAEGKGFLVESAREDVSVEMDLPPDFDAYLELLDSKQRHEVRRKLRRLNEEGKIEYRFIESGSELPGALDTFFRMFVESRQDKAEFLTDRMKTFFRSMTAAMAEISLLKLGVLELDGKPVAEILCFDYQGGIYLYNSGYDPQYVSLSAGLLSKVLAIKNSIENGRKKFDFLKGQETYKYHLGGKEVPLYRCRITM
jgi:CelD/BcsL family acetyltransferase involved in cellulose biosynthesis